MHNTVPISLSIASFLLAVSLMPWESVDASLVWIPQYISRKNAPNYYLGRRDQLIDDKRGWGLSSITNAANSALDSASDLVPGSLDDAKNMASDLGNSALEKGTQIATENGVPMSVEEAQALAAKNGVPASAAELEAIAKAQGLPMDVTGLKDMAADQGFDLAQYEALIGGLNQEDLASAAGQVAGQVAGQIAGGGSNIESTLLSMEILDKLSEVKELVHLVTERCGEAPSVEIGEGESSEITESEAEKRGDLVRAFGKRGDLVRAFGKRGDLVRAFGKRGDLVRAFGKRGDLVRGFGKEGALVRAFAGKRSDPTADLIGLGTQLAPAALNPVGALAGAGGGADTGGLYTILAELDEVILEMERLVFD